MNTPIRQPRFSGSTLTRIQLLSQLDASHCCRQILANESIEEAIARLRELVSFRSHFPTVISYICEYDRDVLRPLVHILSTSSNPAMTLDLIWILINVTACSDRIIVAKLVNAGCIPILAGFAISEDKELSLQAIWCLANIAGVSSDFRDRILQENIVQSLVDLLTKPDEIDLPLARKIVWLFSNLSGGHPAPSFEQIRWIVRPIVDLIRNIQAADGEIVKHGLSTFKQFVECEGERIYMLLDAGALLICVNVIKATPFDFSSKILALQFLANVINIYQQQLQLAVESGAITVNGAEILKNTDHSFSDSSRKCYSSVLAIGRHASIVVQALLDETELVERLIAVIKRYDVQDYSTVVECMFVLSSIVCFGSQDQVNLLVDKRMFTTLCFALSSGSPIKTEASIGIDQLLGKASYERCLTSVLKLDFMEMDELRQQKPPLLSIAMYNSNVSRKKPFITLLLAMGCDANVIDQHPYVDYKDLRLIVLLCSVVYLPRMRPQNHLWLPVEFWRKVKEAIV